jgi:MCP family monocarboxylic acid transporter-like MFS transporter 10
MRITGFVLMVMFGAANLLVSRRLPGKNVKGGLFNFRLFLNPAYTLYGIACIVGFLGIYTRKRVPISTGDLCDIH